MRSSTRWLLAVVVLAIAATRGHAQNTLDRDEWLVAEGDWGNDDNWIDDTGQPSSTPTFDDDRWALISSGVATVSDDNRTSGLTVKHSWNARTLAGRVF